jgi:hypothetical protein
MNYSIQKHANGNYLIKVSKESYTEDYNYMLFCDLYFKSNFRDIKKLLNMEECEGVTHSEITLKTSLETLEIVLAIAKDFPYYTTTELEQIIDEINLGEEGCL